MMPKKIAIIGSGASGLAAIKSCLDEGLEPVCFERMDHIGGLWYYTEQVSENQGCIMRSTTINTSKEFMAYSDFLIPAEFPMYMHHSKVLEYFKMYSKEINSEKYTRFSTEILNVGQAKDFDSTGQWELNILSKKDGVKTMEVFDAVMLCTGHHAQKHVPHFEGIETFKGDVVHTHDYRHCDGYSNKRVVIIGIGNSGGDIAVELGKINCQVYLSTRRGSWVLHRIAKNGLPTDLSNVSRFKYKVTQMLPPSLVGSVMENRLNDRMDHEAYGLKPKHSPMSQHPMVNDELANRIASGTVIIKPDIKRILPTSVEFVDGMIVEDIDTIIVATGYVFGFPFMDHKALDVKNNEVNLYKYVFPPDIKPSTLAVIGCIQPLGAIMPISEIQCRWAAQVFKGAVCLPSAEVMWSDIRQKKETMRKRYVNTQRHTIQVDYIPIMDEIAEHIGCKPSIGKLLLSDPRLGLACYFGPFTPYHYRLQGPNPWPGAREAILTVWDRTIAGTRGGKLPQRTSRVPGLVYVLAVIIFAWLLLRLLG